MSGLFDKNIEKLFELNPFIKIDEQDAKRYADERIDYKESFIKGFFITE